MTVSQLRAMPDDGYDETNDDQPALGGACRDAPMPHRAPCDEENVSWLLLYGGAGMDNVEQTVMCE